MNVPPLAPGEALSPELVLVLPPELRAQVLARLPFPAWPSPRARVLAVPPAGDVAMRTVGQILVTRATQLVEIFVAITILTVVMSYIASAVR